MRDSACFLCGDLSDRDGRIDLGNGLALGADIAPLAPGHMLLHTKEHLQSFALLDPDRLKACERALTRFAVQAEAEDATLLLFEHGTERSPLVASGCTDHAHIHVLPLAVRPWNNPISLPVSASQDVVPTFMEIAALRGRDYYWIGDGRMQIRIVDVLATEHQHLRKVVGNMLGLSRYRTWDLFDEDAARSATARWRELLSDEGAKTVTG